MPHNSTTFSLKLNGYGRGSFTLPASRIPQPAGFNMPVLRTRLFSFSSWTQNGFIAARKSTCLSYFGLADASCSWFLALPAHKSRSSSRNMNIKDTLVYTEDPLYDKAHSRKVLQHHLRISTLLNFNDHGRYGFKPFATRILQLAGSPILILRSTPCFGFPWTQICSIETPNGWFDAGMLVVNPSLSRLALSRLSFQLAQRWHSNWLIHKPYFDLPFYANFVCGLSLAPLFVSPYFNERHFSR
jgi:hypothetical protein